MYLHPTVFDQAAAYMYHISMNQPFIDGNKRAGAACALVFLARNGYVIRPEHNDRLEKLMLGFATHETTKQEAAEYLRRHAEAIAK